MPDAIPADSGKEMNMSRRSWGIPAGLAAAALATAFLSLPASAVPASAARAAGHNASAPAASLNVGVPQRGTGHAGAAEKVNIRTIAAAPRTPARTPAANFPRGINGRPAGASLHHLATRGHRPTPAATPRIATGANSRGTAHGPLQGVRPLMAPGTINTSFNGSAESNCGCIPSDSNAAVGPSNIMETVNNIFQVYNKSGGLQCSALLNNFLLGTSDALSDPRSLYDNLNNRFVFTVAIIPASASATPAQWLAVSQSGNPCGGYFVYRFTFAGGLYPAGALLDYPYLGQDRGALNFSTNNFNSANAYIGSGAFSIPKSAVYNGQGFSFSSSSVAFSTAPVNVAGIPMQATSTTYWLASVPGTGYDLYRMATGGGPLTLQAVISAPFSAPTRDANQPGTSTVINVLDGRLDWPPVQDNGFVWFAHGIDDSGFPTVRLGAINAGGNTVQTAEAFHSGSSDDFDPSIGIADNPGGGIFAWLNWGYTDTPNGVAASDTVNGITPGQGVPSEIATDTTLVTGFSTNQVDPNIGAARFGDNTSVSIDPVSAGAGCPVGRTAVTDNQFYDSNGSWVTRIGRESFC